MAYPMKIQEIFHLKASSLHEQKVEYKRNKSKIGYNFSNNNANLAVDFSPTLKRKELVYARIVIELAMLVSAGTKQFGYHTLTLMCHSKGATLFHEILQNTYKDLLPSLKLFNLLIMMSLMEVLLHHLTSRWSASTNTSKRSTTTTTSRRPATTSTR
uniref:Uncharacterized protein n=1 Tax=Amphimedon queenslandica TaxID=400682 RepID=A0A1X7VS63_AMPQE